MNRKSQVFCQLLAGVVLTLSGPLPQAWAQAGASLPFYRCTSATGGSTLQRRPCADGMQQTRTDAVAAQPRQTAPAAEPTPVRETAAQFAQRSRATPGEAASHTRPRWRLRRR